MARRAAVLQQSGKVNPEPAYGSALEKLPHNFARRGDDGGGDVKRLQIQRQTLEVHSAQMLVARQKQRTFQQRGFGQHQRIVDLFGGDQPLFANPLGDPPGNAVPDGDQVCRNNAPLPAKLNCLPGGLLLLPVTAESQVRQFLLHGGRDEKAGVAKPLPDYVKCLDDVIPASGEVKKNIRVNGDELRPVWSHRHSRAS